MMPDFSDCYEQASAAAQELRRAHASLVESKGFKLTVSRARRYLARARTAFGKPTVNHQRQVRICREALEHLEQAIVTFETKADVLEAERALQKAERWLRRIRTNTVGI